MPFSKEAEVIKPECKGARILVNLQPDDKLLSLPRPKIARQLLAALNLEEESALVIRNSQLLTPDRRIWPNDEITVRLVTSKG